VHTVTHTHTHSRPLPHITVLFVDKTVLFVDKTVLFVDMKVQLYPMEDAEAGQYVVFVGSYEELERLSQDRCERHG